MADAASSPSAAAAAPLRCRNETPAAPRARAAGAASASLASRASSHVPCHVPSSHDCCRSRCASVDVLAGIACAPAGWSCAGTFASSALSATGASGLFRSLLLQSRCLEAAMFATGLRIRLRRLSARRLPSLGPDPAALAHPVEVPRGYAVACVCGYFWVPVLLWVPGYFLVHVLQVPKPASGWRPRVSGARATRLASTASPKEYKKTLVPRNVTP